MGAVAHAAWHVTSGIHMYIPVIEQDVTPLVCIIRGGAD